GVAVETFAIAAVAQNLDVGEEAHFYGAHALSFAHRAASFASIEGEARSRPAPYPGFTCIGKQFAHVVPEAHISGGAGARRFAYGRLVDFQYTVDGLPAADAGAAMPHGLFASAHCLRKIVEQHIARQRGFA